ncbi:MAG: 16S rRNA processing protein RimM [Tannerella sp.]|jgi:16S rRNA processing protein RimM|nr:16S rRNA processing protein RimM [Tannerella sp.]
MIRAEELHLIGQFAKPHGVRGEIALATDYDLAGIIDKSFVACEIDGIFVPFFVESYRQKGRRTALLKFENMDVEHIRLLAGKSAYINAELAADCETESAGYDTHRLAGYTITDNLTNLTGNVVDVNDATINVLIIADYDGEERLIPAAFINSIDNEHKKITLTLPQGFFDI